MLKGSGKTIVFECYGQQCLFFTNPLSVSISCKDMWQNPPVLRSARGKRVSRSAVAKERLWSWPRRAAPKGRWADFHPNSESSMEVQSQHPQVFWWSRRCPIANLWLSSIQKMIRYRISTYFWMGICMNRTTPQNSYRANTVWTTSWKVSKAFCPTYLQVRFVMYRRPSSSEALL